MPFPADGQDDDDNDELVFARLNAHFASTAGKSEPQQDNLRAMLDAAIAEAAADTQAPEDAPPVASAEGSVAGYSGSLVAARRFLADKAEREELLREQRWVARDAQQARARDESAFLRLQARYGWTREEYDRFRLLSTRDQERFLDNERKKLKRSPRKNAKPSEMSPEDAKEHRKKQVRAAKQRERAKAKGNLLASADDQAKTEGTAAVMKQDVDPVLEDLLKALEAAERAEEDREHER